MSVALATHQPVLLYLEDCQQWGRPREELQLVSKTHRLKWRCEPSLNKREGTNRHIFSDLRNMTIAYIRMLAGVWHSSSNWISQALCPLITCWAVTWKVLICGKGARCSGVEVTGVKDPIPSLFSILELLYSGDGTGTTFPVVKPNTKLDIQLQI